MIRTADSSYKRLPAAAFRDLPARLTARQAVFYRNLISLAEAIQSRHLPVDFELPDSTRVFLDRGCIKIAEHAGFIEPLRNGPAGSVDAITLTWRIATP